jgi:hypothetical protein
MTARKLPANLGVVQVLPSDHSEGLIRRNQSLDTPKCLLDHRVSPDKVDELFR